MFDPDAFLNQLELFQVSNSEQSPIFPMCNSRRVNDGIHVLAVELDGDVGLVVTFSDGTTGGYVIEELLQLGPVRERVKQED
jgi:hypothetical protein